MTILAVFDFDHTIICDNSDAVFANLLPKQIAESPDMKNLRKSSWTRYMDQIFKVLPCHGINRDELEKICCNFQANDGMIDLFQYLKEIKAEIVILSDANYFTIDTWINHNLPTTPIKKIITNKSSWKNNTLILEPYEDQSHCGDCPENLCKGSVMETLMKGQNYDFIMYVGDGKNDLCPSRKLKTTDLVFARKNYKLAKLLENNQIQAQVHIWDSGKEIAEKIALKL